MPGVPAIVKHMTLAIYKGTKLVAPSKARFKQAYNIAMSKCQQHGYVQGGQATAKGRLHESEGGAGEAKSRLFDEMYAWAMGGPNPPKKAAAPKKAATSAKTDAEAQPKLPGQPIKTDKPPGIDDTGYNTAHYLGRNKRR